MHKISINDVRVLPGDAGFLIDDGKTSILYDCGFAFTGEKLAQNVKNLLGNRNLDFIFLTHSHYDHALGAVYVKEIFPEAKVVAGSYAAGIFKKESAKKVMRDLDQKFAAKNGVNNYRDLIDNLCVDVEVLDGDKIQCGEMTFTVVELPGHTKCSVGFYLEENELLLGTETLGVYTGTEKIIPSYLVGFDLTMKSFEKAEKLKIKNILVPHYGLLNQKESAFYLEKGKENSVETANEILASLKAGVSKVQILEQFKEKYYVGYVKEIYPIDAMELNTNIMINLIERELME
ncbi:MAG: MBL fold metallo-hydrolase [Treponema bryantii]|nr:MBL fold metallo-hydrolase [Treponema bryantii]